MQELHLSAKQYSNLLYMQYQDFVKKKFYSISILLLFITYFL